jgi:hypothetical protein
MSYVLFSAWSVASPFQFDHHVQRPIQYMHSGQTLPARPPCPMSYSVDGVWPASLFLLDHHVLCPVQCMESGQSVPFLLDHHVLCPMSCPLQGVKALADQGNAAD